MQEQLQKTYTPVTTMSMLIRENPNVTYWLQRFPTVAEDLVKRVRRWWCRAASHSVTSMHACVGDGHCSIVHHACAVAHAHAWWVGPELSPAVLRNTSQSAPALALRCWPGHAWLQNAAGSATGACPALLQDCAVVCCRQVPKGTLYNIQLQPFGVVSNIYPYHASSDADQIGRDLLYGQCACSAHGLPWRGVAHTAVGFALRVPHTVHAFACAASTHAPGAVAFTQPCRRQCWSSVRCDAW